MDSLRVERREDGQVAEVELIGPGKGNAMGRAFWRELPAVLAELDADPQVRVVLLRAAGPSFCFGLDLAEMAGFLEEAAGPAAARLAWLHELTAMQGTITAVEDCRKPVVAAVQGWCLGGGVDLVAAADVRLASADAIFSIREVRMAIVADVGSLQRLPGIIGEAATRRLALTGEDVSADRAAALGLVSDVFADHEALLAGARGLCRSIAANPPLVVQGVKAVLNASRDLPRRDALAHVALWNAAFIATEDLREAVAAFAEKRAPRFVGR